MSRPRLLALVALSLLLPLMGGCNILGYAAAVIPGPPQAARYPGLAGQRVAIVTWADKAAVFNYQTFGSDVTLDVSLAVQAKLQQAQASDPNLAELKGTYFVDARQVYKWGKNHPELEDKSVQELAPRLSSALGVTRVVYLELQPFQTRDPKTEILMKGYTVANIRVAEVNGAAARLGYEEVGMAVDYPKNAPEGVPPSETMNESHIYRGLVDELSTEVATRFFSYVIQ